MELFSSVELIILGIVCVIGLAVPVAAVVGVLLYTRNKQKP